MKITFHRIHQLIHDSLLLQLTVLLGLWWLGNEVAALARLPIPGAVVGMTGLLALFLSGGISLDSMRRGAHLLLAEMLLFFVPAVLAILDHPELLGWRGLKVLAVIAVGTVVVMLVTVGVVDLVGRLLSGPHNHESPVPQLD